MMRNIKALYVALLFLTLCATTPKALAINDYYVSPSGSGSTCSQASPCSMATVDTVLVVGSAGTCSAGTNWISASGIGACIHVASGTYSGSVQTNKNGTASARIRYVSDTQYGARLLGSSSGAVMWAVTGSYTDVVGFDFDGSVNAAAIDGLVVYQTAPHSNILFNRLHDIDNSPTAENHNAVLQSNSGGACTGCFGPGFTAYTGNLLYHNGDGAGHSVPGGGGQTGISLGNDDTMQDNIVMDNGKGWCVQATHSSTRNIITNNTLINCDRGGIRMGNDSGTGNDFTTVSNNIIVNNGGFGSNYGFYNTACGIHNIYANNLFYGNLPADINPCPSGPQFTGTQSGSNSTTFVNYTGTVSGDYHPKAGSTAIGAGTTSCASGAGLCAPPVDFSGAVQTIPPVIGALIAIRSAGGSCCSVWVMKRRSRPIS